jgi:gas vesicle protein
MARTGSKMVIAVLAGVAAGIGIGMLIAPAKGSKTRKRLKKRILGLADMMQDELAEKVSAIRSAITPDDDEPEESELREKGKEA